MECEEDYTLKLRTPSSSPPSGHIPITIHDNWHRLQVTTITPIYGGGVTAGEPDTELPVRASAIRGQLRFWWRLLHRTHCGRALFIAERALWGAMGQPNRDYASKIRLRVRDVGNVRPEPCARFNQGRDGRYRSTPAFLHSIPPYALFPGQGQLTRDRRSIEKDPAEVLMPGLRFSLDVECPLDRWPEVEQTLRWWASFGGLGARTRRGLGSVRVAGLSPVTQTETEQAGCRLVQKHPSQRDPNAAWKTAVEALQKFRQGVNLGRNPGQEPNRPGRSRWPEPDALRRITGKIRVKADGVALTPEHPAGDVFPRAYFGMPIIFHFQGEHGDQQADPGDMSLQPARWDRMASPLILKALALGEDEYAPCALLLPADRVEGLALTLANTGSARNPRLPLTLTAGGWWPEGTAAALALAQDIAPMQNRQQGNPLLAFLDYFEKGRWP